jgi:hypothetical protein
MDAAISPADRTLNLVISVSLLDTESKTFWRLLWKWVERRFKLNICSWSFTAARGRRRNRSQIPARARHAPLRVYAPSAAKILFTVRREFFNGLRNAAGCRHQHHADRRSVIATPLREGMPTPNCQSCQWTPRASVARQ